MRSRHSGLMTPDDIRADIDALRGHSRTPRFARQPVSATDIRRRTGLCLMIGLILAVALILLGVAKLAISVGGAILHLVWPAHLFGQVVLDLLRL